MNKLSGTLLAVLLLVVANAWGGCTSGSFTLDYWRDVSGLGTETNCGGNNTCTYYGTKICATAIESTDSRYLGCKIQQYRVGSDVWNCPHTNANCTACNYNVTVSKIVCDTYCDTQCDVDSLNCSNAGGTWTNTGASTCDGKSCKMSNCLQSDTLWLNDSKAACDAIGGENNYAITDIDETCVHSGICCPPDSALVGNTCKWRCDSLYTACNAKNGYLYAGVLQDTTVSGADSIFTNKCYYNCSYAYNKDSTTSVTDGNTACSSPSTPIADCTRMPNDFSSVRTTYGDSVYSYDFLTPGSAAYIDSIVLTPCSRFMYRCTINGKYRYWYSDADIPTGCTNIVKIK